MREPAKINVDEDEIVMGPFIVEWDARGGGVQVAKGEDAVAYIEHITTSQWEDFVYACHHGSGETDE